jgi:hypothetical protein
MQRGAEIACLSMERLESGTSAQVLGPADAGRPLPGETGDRRIRRSFARRWRGDGAASPAGAAPRCGPPGRPVGIIGPPFGRRVGTGKIPARAGPHPARPRQAGSKAGLLRACRGARACYGFYWKMIGVAGSGCVRSFTIEFARLFQAAGAACVPHLCEMVAEPTLNLKRLRLCAEL